MAVKYASRVKQLTDTTGGTGSLTFASTPDGFRSFTAAGVGASDTFFYLAESTTIAGEWEVGYGSTDGTTLTRTDVILSSAGTPNKTNFTPGEAVEVSLTLPGEYIQGGPNDTTIPGTAFGSYNTTGAGLGAFAVGVNNTASANSSSAFGYNNTSSQDASSAFGASNSASGYYSSAVGFDNTASGNYSSAFGCKTSNSGDEASAVGHGVVNTVNRVQEIGYWNTTFNVRISAVRIHGDGYVAISAPVSDTALTYGGATAGSEADGTLMRRAYSIRINTSGEPVLDYAGAEGAITSTSLAGVDLSGTGIDSTSVGVNNTASDDKTSAFGYYNTASANSASAVGMVNVASDTAATAFGAYNNATTTACSAVGCANWSSGYSSSAIGYNNTASGSESTAIGYQSDATGDESTAIGYQSDATGYKSNAVGWYSAASAFGTSAFGYATTASGSRSAAFGRRAKTTQDNSVELGFWGSSSVRSSAVRVQGYANGDQGYVTVSMQNTATALTDGGATAGSEADGTLMREAYSIRRNGNEILIDINVAGTIRTLSLGTAT